MSRYKEAQDWLTAHRMYPGPGLANALWGPDRRYLAVVTRRWQVILYRVEPPEVLWAGEPDPQFAGMEFLDASGLVVRRHARLSDGAVGDRVGVEVTLHDQEVEARWVSVDEECRTLGHSLTGRFQLFDFEGDGRAPGRELGMIDLGPWDRAEPGRYEAVAVPHVLSGLEEALRFAQISPDGTRMIARTGSKASSGDHFLDLRAPDSAVAMPTYPWARPRYLWSPDGRWIGAVIQEHTPEDWDEIPVGGPELRSFVAVHDGGSGGRVWLERVETVHAPFEWTPSGALVAGRAAWDPASGKRLSG